MRVLLLPIAASLGTLLLFAGSAGAAPDSAPLHSWSISKIEQGYVSDAAIAPTIDRRKAKA